MQTALQLDPRRKREGEEQEEGGEPAKRVDW